MPNTAKDVCVICYGPLDDKFGHNPQPISGGRCCTTCNYTIVIPARLGIMLRSQAAIAINAHNLGKEK